MGDALIRPGRPDEAPDMLEVMAAALAVEADAGGIVHAFPDHRQEIAWLQYLLTTGEGRVAEADGRIAGFGITAKRGSIDWLVSLFVHPQAQGRGIGREILDALWPPDSIALRATLVDAAARAAVALYLRAGLTPRIPVLAFEGRIAATGPGDISAREDWAEVAQRVAQADEAAFGAARLGDHAHWAERGFAFRSLWSRTGIWLGYGRWSPTGRLGPVVLSAAANWATGLGALAASAAREGLDTLHMMVPAVNEAALHACRVFGLSYRGMEIAMATQSLHGWDHCLIHRAGLP